MLAEARARACGRDARSATARGRSRWSIQNTGWLPTYVSKRALARKTVRGIVAEIELPAGASLATGKLRDDVGQLEGKAYKHTGVSFWPDYNVTDDRMKLEWIVRGEAGATVGLVRAARARRNGSRERGARRAEGLKIPGGVWTLGFVSLLMDTSSELIHALLPLYMVGALGASVLVVGIIEGFAEAIALIVKVFSGYWSDVTFGIASRSSCSAMGSPPCRSSCFRWRRRWAGSSPRASPTASARAFAARRATR